jgi:hypothetical protein
MCLYHKHGECRECWLYVVASLSDGGPVKVGVSFTPSLRLYQHRRKTCRDLRIIWKRQYRCEFRALDAEERALRKLSPWRVRGDWFALPTQKVVDITTGVS